LKNLNFKSAIILAGGFGTRLKEVVKDIPKPMANINNKPFLEILLNYLKKNGIEKVILSVGYKKEIIIDYFKDYFNDLKIVYSIEDKPLKTGGAIKKALEKVKENEVFILNGDTFFDIELKKLLLDDCDLAIALKKVQNVDRYGIVEINNNGYIKNFKEKQYIKNGLINGGVYLIKKDIFKNYNKEIFSFEEFLENNVNLLKIKGYIFKNYFIDIGIPADYEKAIKELS